MLQHSRDPLGDSFLHFQFNLGILCEVRECDDLEIMDKRTTLMLYIIWLLELDIILILYTLVLF